MKILYIAIPYCIVTVQYLDMRYSVLDACIAHHYYIASQQSFLWPVLGISVCVPGL